MKTPWIRILHTGGYPASSCSPLGMCVYGHISSGCLCSDSSSEFLIFSPGMFHLSPYPASHTRDGQSFPLISPAGSLCWWFSSHKWKITLSWTLDIPIFKSRLAVPIPGNFSLALFSPKSHPHFIFQNLLSASSSHLFPCLSLFLGSSPTSSNSFFTRWETCFYLFHSYATAIFKGLLHKAVWRTLFSSGCSLRSCGNRP